MGWAISGVDRSGSCSIFGSVWLWVGLLRVFGLRSVDLIADVSSDMGLGCSIWVLGLWSILPAMHATQMDVSKSI